MENKLIEIQDLEVGDEILISCQSFFKYLRILEKPRFSKKLHWRTNQPLYKAVRCSARKITTTKVYNNYAGTSWTREEKQWVVTPEEHNVTIYQNLEDRQIFLVKRGQII